MPNNIRPRPVGLINVFSPLGIYSELKSQFFSHLEVKQLDLEDFGGIWQILCKLLAVGVKEIMETSGEL